MTVTTVAVIYSKNQRRRRRLVVPEHSDIDLFPHVNGLHPGEGIFLVPHHEYKVMKGSTNEVPHPEIDGRLNIHLGGPALSDRCAIVGPDNIVTAVVCADPLIDKVSEGFQLIYCNTDCQTGWVYDGKGFVAP